jgi:hypothetical protein
LNDYDTNRSNDYEVHLGPLHHDELADLSLHEEDDVEEKGGYYGTKDAPQGQLTLNNKNGLGKNIDWLSWQISVWGWYRGVWRSASS